MKKTDVVVDRMSGAPYGQGMPIRMMVTHPGGAHKDDFLACAVMLARFPVEICRREPTEEELENREVCVIDVGGKHEPEKMNFDHHQFPREQVPTCALSLVLQHLGLYDDARLFCDWLEPAEWFDCRGPNKTAEWLGVEREVIGQLSSPIDISMLRRFAGAERHVSGEPVYELMRMVGEDLVEYLQGVRGKINYVSERVQRWDIKTEEGDFSALYLPRGEDMIEDASGGLARYIFVNDLEDEIAAMVYPDSRGEGHGLARFRDHPRLDFTRVESEVDVHFAHNSGFLCKTGATEEERLQNLLAMAWK